MIETSSETMETEICTLRELLKAIKVESNQGKSKSSFVNYALHILTWQWFTLFICLADQAESEELNLKMGLEKDDLSHNNNSKLPQEILGLAFKNFEQESLLNCRLVCKSWKNAVDDHAFLMRRLTFNVYDWRSFLESTIIDKGRSVRIAIPWNVDVKSQAWLEFAMRLGQTVEEIKCDFYYQAVHPFINKHTAKDIQRL